MNKYSWIDTTKNNLFKSYFRFKSKLVPGFTLAALVPTKLLDVEGLTLHLSTLDFLGGTEYSSSRFSLRTDLQFVDGLNRSIFSSSSPTSSSMFCERSSVSTSEDGVLSTIAGIVISSNGELGRVESGVVDTDP